MINVSAGGLCVFVISGCICTGTGEGPPDEAVAPLPRREDNLQQPLIDRRLLLTWLQEIAAAFARLKPLCEHPAMWRSATLSPLREHDEVLPEFITSLNLFFPLPV